MRQALLTLFRKRDCSFSIDVSRNASGAGCSEENGLLLILSKNRKLANNYAEAENGASRDRKAERRQPPSAAALGKF